MHKNNFERIYKCLLLTHKILSDSFITSNGDFVFQAQNMAIVLVQVCASVRQTGLEKNVIFLV